MEYRVLTTTDELQAAFRLEIAVWGVDPADAVPTSMLRAVQHAGGVLHGAFDADQLIGVTLAFPARADAGWVLWSHMAGVDPAHQGQGIGCQLKHRQREWALTNGYDQIRWTFDPLQRGNANFNLRQLGATAHQYHVNFYGTMRDAINRDDLPSDRLEAIWRLRDSPPSTAADAGDCPFLLIDAGLPERRPLDGESPVVRAQIPRRLAALNAEQRLQWRLALREVLVEAFARGYRAVDFTAENAYVLRRL